MRTMRLSVPWLVSLAFFSPLARADEALTIYADVSEVFGPAVHVKKYAPASNPWIFDQERTVWSRGDAGGSMSVCPATSRYQCVQSEGFRFAVPKGSIPSSWEYDGVVYTVVDDDYVMSFMTITYAVRVIQALFELDVFGLPVQVEYRYLYSSDQGLLGFSQSVVDCDKTPREVFGDDSACGVGGIFVLQKGTALFATL